jgi:anti-sigma B factor antagonist
MNQQCRIRTRTVGTVAVVEISGRLDPGYDRDGLLRATEKLIGEGMRRFLLDLSRVSFITSLGVGALLNMLQLVTQHEGKLKFLNPAHCVRTILSVAKLDGLFETYTDEDEAIRSFTSEPPPEPSNPAKKPKAT